MSDLTRAVINQGPFRCLEIPTGETKDHDGREVGDDHPVLFVDPTCNGEAFDALAVTTDHVHTSEYGDLVPGTQAGLARLIADCLNRQYKAMGFREWTRLVAQHDEPTHPPVDHPRQYDTCAGCGLPMVDGSAHSLEGGAWVPRCSACWLVSMQEREAARPRRRRVAGRRTP